MSSAQPLTSFHTRELSSTTPLVTQEGAVFGQRRFQQVPSIWEGSVAAAFWAVPQPRLLPRHNIVEFAGEGHTSACPSSLIYGQL